uniref:FkbM family methyltransferase n=1 Tax=Geobacter metallireducens TaxID=28232 RepID=A0A831U1W3_GEOME
MIASVEKRLRIIKSMMTGDDHIRYSTWKDVAHETLKRYGRHKAEIRKQMSIVQIDDQLRVEMAGRVIYWPANANRSRLADMYFEVFDESNNHYFDIPETSIQPGDVVLDCGACEGYFTLKALEAGASKVYSIEPGESISRCLSRSFASEISDGRVSLHACLLGDHNEDVLFYEDPEDPTVCRFYSRQEQVILKENIRAVEMMTIDEFCARQNVVKVDFIKADVEGGEVSLLRGAQKTLKKFKPKLAFAAYHNSDDANQMVQCVDGLGLGYRFRVKGIVDFEKQPRPVMVHCY